MPDYRIVRTSNGCAIELDGVVVAVTTGDEADARTLISDPDFQAEVEEWLRALKEEE